MRIESNAPQHIIVRPCEGAMTDAKTDEVLIDSLWPCPDKDGCAGMLGPMDVICLEEVEYGGSDNTASRRCGLCGTISSKVMNKATNNWIIAAMQLGRYRSVMLQ